MSSKTILEMSEDQMDFRDPAPDAALFARGCARLPYALGQMGFSSLRPGGQDEIVMALLAGVDSICILPTSGGKCFAAGTMILMASGRSKAVEDITSGEYVMGPDGIPRKVGALCRGRDRMYRITPQRGKAYTVNSEHVLSLQITGMKKGEKTLCAGKRFGAGEIANVSVKDYLKASKTFKHVAKGWKSRGIQKFHHTDAPYPSEMPPYMLGVWLGDGTSSKFSISTADPEVVSAVHAYANSLPDHQVTVYEGDNCPSYSVVNRAAEHEGRGYQSNVAKRILRELNLLNADKFIPDCYKFADEETRLEILAGLIDTDGYLNKGAAYDIISKYEILAEDIAFVARSLGLHATVNFERKRCTNTDVWGDYWRVYISGDVWKLPVRVARRKSEPHKRRTDPLRSAFDVKDLGEGDYYGFSIEGPDKLFLLEDFTVTHNSACFVIPALCHDWRLLIFSPLKALMVDQVRSLNDKGIPALAISSDNNDAVNRRNLGDWQDGACKIMFVAPERLGNDEFMQVMRQAPPDMVAIDETHTLSSWSDNFRHHYVHIGTFIEQFRPRLVAGFTATYSAEIDKDVRRVLRIPKAVVRAFYPRRTNLILSSSELMSDSTYQVAQWMRKIDGPILMYCNSRKRTEEWAMRLTAELGETVGFYNAGVTTSVKREMQDAFFSGGLRVMVATNAFGMGIDKVDVRSVIHIDHPSDPESLSQECVHPESWISTSASIKIASEVVLGDKMIDYGFAVGQTREAIVRDTMHNKFKGNLTVVRTKLGSTLRLTPSHPVFVSRLGSVVEVPAGELVVGDRLLAQKNLEAECQRTRVIDLITDCPEPVFAGVEPSMIDDLRAELSVEQMRDVFRLSRLYDYSMYKRPGSTPRLDYLREACRLSGISEEVMLSKIAYFKTRSGQKTILPEYLTEDLGWLAGIMATDGYMFKQESRRDTDSFYGSWKIKLGITCPVIADKFQSILQCLGLHVSRSVRAPYRGSKVKSKKDMITSEVSSPILMHLLNKLGIPSGAKSYLVTVPSWFRNESKEVRGAYLAGVIDGVGSIKSAGAHQIRVHSASWSMISGVSGLLRGFGIMASCYAEDYTRKREVMNAAADHGYSLRISSCEDLEAVRSCIAPFMCKNMRDELPPVRKSFEKVRNSRRAKVSHEGAVWMEDTVLELHDERYEGTVLNWRVEPGNQLVVEGILTHNCGRAGRDGKDSWCHTYSSQMAERQATSRIRDGNPTRGTIQQFFDYMTCRADRSNVVDIPARQVQKDLGISEYAYLPLIQLFLGSGILTEATDIPRVSRLRFKDPYGCDSIAFSKLKDALDDISTPDPEFAGGLVFSPDRLCEALELSQATVTKNLKGWQSDGILVYDPPGRTQPKRIIGNLDLIDLERMEAKRKLAFKKLEVVLDYFNVDDSEKHDYLEEYFTAFSK